MSSDCVAQIEKCLRPPRDFATALAMLRTLDWNSLENDERARIADAVEVSLTAASGPLFMLSLSAKIQAELAVSAKGLMLGVDRSTYGSLQPDQVVRALSIGQNSSLSRLLRKIYDFRRLKKEHWREIFLTAHLDFLPKEARPFLENKDGEGFTHDEVRVLAQKCPALIDLLDAHEVLDLLLEKDLPSSAAKAAIVRLGKCGSSWSDFSLKQLKALLKIAPEFRTKIAWQKWPFADVAELMRTNRVFEEEFPYRRRFFCWKYAKGLAVMTVLFAALMGWTAKNIHDASVRDRYCELLNAHVSKIWDFDQKRDYEALKAYWQDLSADLQSVISPDLFVKKARKGLATWESNGKELKERVSWLHKIEKAGWGTIPSGSVDSSLVQAADLARMVGGDAPSEVVRLRKSYSDYCAAEAEKTLVRDWRARLDAMRTNVCQVVTVRELETLREKVSGCPDKPVLEKQKSDVLVALEKRMDVLEVLSVSNAVCSVASELKGMKAIDDFAGVANRFAAIGKMPGFEKYAATSARTEYAELADDVKLLRTVQSAYVGDMKRAEKIVGQTKSSLLMEDGRVVCSNLVAECASFAVATTNRPAWSMAFKRLKDQVDAVVAKDARCRGLIAKLNATRSYSEYLEVRRALLSEFGGTEQLSMFKDMYVIPAEQLVKEYEKKTPWYIANERYRCHFVGVIRLNPDNPASVYVDVAKNDISENADLYCFALSQNGKATPFRFFYQSGIGRYYKAFDESFDYSCWQGAPLFVRTDQYEGRTKQ